MLVTTRYRACHVSHVSVIKDQQVEAGAGWVPISPTAPRHAAPQFYF